MKSKYRVNIVYHTDVVNTYRERQLRSLATTFGGEEYGAGYGWGYRDIQFGGFKTEEIAQNFFSRAMRYKSLKWIKRLCYVEKDIVSTEDFY